MTPRPGTSRTGTARHKRWRVRVLHLAQANGQTHCPDCGQPLAWGTTLQPRSPEPDHVVPAARGGRDTIDNARVTCRQCNQKRGSKPIPSQPRPTQAHTVGGIQW
nr:MAG TPA: HNH endonuclease [Caudoviricetes sp.]DAP23410.1 MAG TPA: HNH endonuclease [Caudoviricetes sp.]DAQ06137.1 MAG TPA: HNH endonuclease [Caudoviricetes sp.]